MYRIISVILSIIALQSFAQNTKLDSLKKLVSTSEEDSTKFETLKKLYDYCYVINDTIELNKTENEILNLAIDPDNDIPYRHIYRFGFVLENRNKYDQAIKLYELALQKSEKENGRKSIEIESWLGYTLSKVGESDKGLQHCLNALQNVENYKGEKRNFSKVYLLTAFVYKNSNQYEKALIYFKKTSQLAKKEGDRENLHNSLHEIGNTYLRSNIDSALLYHKEALAIRESEKDSSALIFSYHDIAIDYTNLDSLDKANEYLYKAESIAKKKNDKWMLINIYQNIGDIYLKQNKFDKSLQLMLKAKTLADELNMKSAYERLYYNLYSLHRTQRKFEKALEYFEQYTYYRDSISSVEIQKNISELDKKYETAKKDKKLIENQEYIKRQRIVIIFVIIGLILVSAFMIIAIGLFRQKKAAYIILEHKNQEILSQKEEIQTQAENLEEANIKISHQMEVIERNHTQITASINYARRIQEAMLPVVDVYKENFTDSFIFYQPCDIVSGDFYWAEKVNDKIVFAVADCTGHGVPGAMVSMLGMSLLNKVVIQSKNFTTDSILNELRVELKTALKQKGNKLEAKDGMDIAICILDRERKKLQFSGAYCNTYLFRENELIELKANSQPIGVFFKEKDFSRIEMDVKEGDILYMFSDGFSSQFHHSTKEKIKVRRFKELLLEINKLSFEEQNNILEKYFNEWKGHQHQVDDVLVLGLKM